MSGASARPADRVRRLKIMMSEALREIGVLLIAFAPLDWAISSPRPNFLIIASFTVAGIGFLSVGMAIEWRSTDA